MSTRLSRILIALCGILGIALLSVYFGVGFGFGLAQLPPDATLAQVTHVATQYHNIWRPFQSGGKPNACWESIVLLFCTKPFPKGLGVCAVAEQKVGITLTDIRL